MKTISTEIQQFENHTAHLALITHPRLVCNFHAYPEYHSHPEAEVLIILQGEGYKIIDGIVSRFQSGDMVFLPAHTPHMWMVDEIAERENNQSLLLYINPSAFEQLFENLEEFGSIHRFLNNSSALSFHGHTRQSVLTQLQSLLKAEGFDKIMGIFRALQQLAESGEYEKLPSAKNPAAQENIHKDPLIDVLQFVQKNLSRPIRLSEAANIAQMMPAEFARHFKRSLKNTFSSFVQSLRFDKARFYLTETDKQISEISTLCGYPSTSRFCQLFKIKYGKSPLRFRQEHPHFQNF